MGKVINVSSFEELDRASSSLKSLSADYKDIYTQLMNAAETMGTAWEGADNQAFVERITGFTAELGAMADRLESASEMISTIRQNYSNRQDDNITQVNKLMN